jgi:hypothetical protein
VPPLGQRTTAARRAAGEGLCASKDGARGGETGGDRGGDRLRNTTVTEGLRDGCCRRLAPAGEACGAPATAPVVGASAAAPSACDDPPSAFQASLKALACGPSIPTAVHAWAKESGGSKRW